jgi:transposase-like protein
VSKAGIEVETDPQLERRTRRRVSAAEKQRLLSESEQLAHGEHGAWLRRNGLYAAQLSMWRKQLSTVGSSGLEPKAPGRKPKDPSVREIEQLRRENAKLLRRAVIAEQLVELQKKLCQLVEDAQHENSL